MHLLPSKAVNLLPSLILILLLGLLSCSVPAGERQLKRDFRHPPQEAKPWVFWYWMNAAVSREGITADLEAMRQAGMGGAYLMTIGGPGDPPLLEPPVIQLTPEWWQMIRFAMQEAERLELAIAMHAGDGFAVAGGPWISPEMSMQQVVWTTTIAEGGRKINRALDRPLAREGYYRDIAVYAFPVIPGTGNTSLTQFPTVRTSLTGTSPAFLADEDHRQVFRSDEPCWIQYTFREPFTCRSITIHTPGTNVQAHRLIIQSGNDGTHFTSVCRLEPPRHGWQDEGPVTHAIKPVTARYFRFLYDPEGSEPGAEDLDFAKWKPSLKITGIELSGEPRIHQYEGKNGSVWRICRRSTEMEIPDSLCIQPGTLQNITDRMDAEGNLSWDAPPGLWTILRMGHTSTGKTNYTGGGGLGLECDKLSREAVQLQFDNWFGAALDSAGEDLAGQVLKILHVDSWECGSQNWSPMFREEFISRRGYDPLDYLPAMAGIPVYSADISERFLYDLRQTIAELVVDVFYTTMAEAAGKNNCMFSSECTAPTMTGDGMLHFRNVDIPMGEFWFRSPSHDKPNDMLDAISGAHTYGKSIIQSESFTELRNEWDEHPGMLKATGDRNYALGANRLVYHVFTHNPWTDRKPGTTLSRIGTFIQRDQTWWTQGREWVAYAQRCQALLQKGVHIADIAVFTGEEVPRRAVLPDRLVKVLPGIIGEDRVGKEKTRLDNAGVPLREVPEGVLHSANMADPGDWPDPLRGYSYDSFNPDVLLNLATVSDGRIVLPGGASYKLLVIPGTGRMSPNGEFMSAEVAAKILELVEEGATVLFAEKPLRSPGLLYAEKDEKRLAEMGAMLFDSSSFHSQEASPGKKISYYSLGKGKVLTGPYRNQSLHILGIEPDFLAYEAPEQRAEGIAWNHRKYKESHIYFISNQEKNLRQIELSLRVTGRQPLLCDPLTSEIRKASGWKIEEGRTLLTVQLQPYGSLFIILGGKTSTGAMHEGPNWHISEPVRELEGPWELFFDTAYGGSAQKITMPKLNSWHLSELDQIRHYSGTATYSIRFMWEENNDPSHRYRISLGQVAIIAEVFLNGSSCGVAWTEPFELDITDRLVRGENLLVIQVTNTWANRLMADAELPPEKRLTWTTAPYTLTDKTPLVSGLLGPVMITREVENCDKTE